LSPDRQEGNSGWSLRTATILILVAFAISVDEGPVPRLEPPIALAGPFVPFGMCMGGMKPSEQVAYCRKIGFSGLGLQDMGGRVLGEFAGLPEVASGEFKIHSALWWTKVTEPVIDTHWFDSTLDQARRMDMAIWMVLDGPDKSERSRSTAVSMAAKAALRCRAKGVRLVLYPHGGCVVSSAEEGLALLDSLDRLGIPEVGLSIHLCHELKAGNRDRLPQVVRKVAHRLELASVSGADSDTYGKDDDNWASAIMPLDRGSFDSRIFLRALSEAGYAGPIQLHTYNLKSPAAPDYDGHLERSWGWWQSAVVRR